MDGYPNSNDYNSLQPPSTNNRISNQPTDYSDGRTELANTPMSSKLNRVSEQEEMGSDEEDEKQKTLVDVIHERLATKDDELAKMDPNPEHEINYEAWTFEEREKEIEMLWDEIA